MTLGSGHPAEGNLSGGDLLGWARSNQDGTAWVVNVGSEEGFATVQIGPEGPPRQFFGFERWQACYHHALGPRGDYLDMWVPDDLARVLLARSAAGHGIGVGYPGYWLTVPRRDPMPDELARGKKLCSVPSGSDIFGFWPGRRDVFVGSIREIAERDPRPGQLAPPEENATWFFTADGRFRSWLRGRRLADAADGRAMLFRMEGSHQVVTLYPDLRTARARRFTWADGSTAIALSLFDDLRLGLFIQDEKLVLAGWDGPKS